MFRVNDSLVQFFAILKVDWWKLLWCIRVVCLGGSCLTREEEDVVGKEEERRQQKVLSIAVGSFEQEQEQELPTTDTGTWSTTTTYSFTFHHGAAALTLGTHLVLCHSSLARMFTGVGLGASSCQCPTKDSGRA